jgi:ABC-type branched-subunit amino acid transport system ATPase component
VGLIGLRWGSIGFDRGVTISDSEAEVYSQLFSGVTVTENLLLGGYTKSASTRKQRIGGVLTHLPRPRERFNQPA